MDLRPSPERARPWTPRERVPIFDREVAPVAPAAPEALVEELDLGFVMDDFPDVFPEPVALALYSDDELVAEVARRNALRNDTEVAVPPLGVDLYCDETLDDPSTDCITEPPRVTPTVMYAFGRCKPMHFKFQMDAVWKETIASVWIHKSHPQWSDSKITDYMPKCKTSRTAGRKAPKPNARFLAVGKGVDAIPPSAVRLLEP